MKSTGNDNFIRAIIDRVVLWQANHDQRLVVGLDGTSGIGKTTIAQQIAERYPHVTVVHLDHFMFPYTDRARALRAAADKPSVYTTAWYNISALQKLIRTFRAPHDTRTLDIIHTALGKEKPKTKTYNMMNKILLLEGVFLRHSSFLPKKMFDKHIFLTTHPAIIHSRKENRAKRRYSNKEINTYNVLHLIFSVAWKRYIEKCNPAEHADLTIEMLIQKSS